MTLHELLTNELAVMDLLDAGKAAEADRRNREWSRKLRNESKFRNRVGYKVLLTVIPNISLDGGIAIDNREAAFLARLKAFLHEHPAPQPAAAH
jgi:hypothetical protein